MKSPSLPSFFPVQPGNAYPPSRLARELTFPAEPVRAIGIIGGKALGSHLLIRSGHYKTEDAGLSEKALSGNEKTRSRFNPFSSPGEEMGHGCSCRCSAGLETIIEAGIETNGARENYLFVLGRRGFRHTRRYLGEWGKDSFHEPVLFIDKYNGASYNRFQTSTEKHENSGLPILRETE